jgi:hypothetical protein
MRWGGATDFARDGIADDTMVSCEHDGAELAPIESTHHPTRGKTGRVEMITIVDYRIGN